MPSFGEHRNSRLWQQAMDLAAEAYRLAERCESPRARLLAEQLVTAAATVPSRVAQAVAAESTSGMPKALAALLDLETRILLAVRLGFLQERQASAALARIGALHEELSTYAAPATRPAPAPQPASKPAPAPPAPEAVAPPRTMRTAPKPETGADRLVVDGCNVLGRAPGYRLGDDASRDRLLLRLQEYAHRHPAHRVTVFFDGQRASHRVTAGVEERVTSGSRPADDVIVDHLRSLSTLDRGRSVLVTDDQELTRRGRDAGVRVRPVAWLAEQLPEPAEPTVTLRREGGLTGSQVQEWEQFFQSPPQRPGKKR